MLPSNRNQKRRVSAGSWKALICWECNESRYKSDEYPQLGDDDAAVNMVYSEIYTTHACLFEPYEVLLDNQADVSNVPENFLADKSRVRPFFAGGHRIELARQDTLNCYIRPDDRN